MSRPVFSVLETIPGFADEFFVHRSETSVLGQRSRKSRVPRISRGNPARSISCPLCVYRELSRSIVLCHIVSTYRTDIRGRRRLRCLRDRPLRKRADAQSGCAVLMQIGGGPSSGITRCQLRQLAYCRDSRLDLSRLNQRDVLRLVFELSLSLFLFSYHPVRVSSRLDCFLFLCTYLSFSSALSFSICRSQFCTFTRLPCTEVLRTFFS